MLFPYLWEFRWRVAIALTFLVAAKLANVTVPLVMKEIVDALDSSNQLLVLPLAFLLMYGALRLSTTLFAELRDVVFVRVTRRAIRRVARVRGQPLSAVTSYTASGVLRPFTVRRPADTATTRSRTASQVASPSRI